MPRKFLRVTLISASLILAATPYTRGQVITVNAPDPVNPPTLEEMDTGRPMIRLTLNEAIQMALEGSFDVQLQDISLLNSNESFTSAELEFDPTLTVSSSFNASQNGASGNAVNRSAHTDNGSVSASISQKLKTGATVSLNSTLFSRANTSGNPNSPSYGRSISLNISQPLLRGFGTRYTLTNLRRSENSLRSAYLSYKSFLISTVNSIESSYNSLIIAREQLIIARSSLELAQQTFDENQARANTGLITQLTLLQSANQLTSSQNSYIQREQALHNAEDNLRLLLGGGDFDIGIIPTDSLAQAEMVVPDVESSYQLALNNGTDYQTRLISVENAEMSVYTAQQNLKPSLNLTGGLSSSDSGLQNGYEVYDRINDDQNFGWNIGLSLNIPLGERNERISYRTALNNLRSAQTQLRQFEANTRVSVRSAVRQIEANIQSVQLSERQVEFSRQTYEAERNRFDVGQSTIRTLNDSLNDYESSQLSLLQSRLTLRNSVNSLRRLEGTTLDRFNVELPTTDRIE